MLVEDLKFLDLKYVKGEVTPGMSYPQDVLTCIEGSMRFKVLEDFDLVFAWSQWIYAVLINSEYAKTMQASRDSIDLVEKRSYKNSSIHGLRDFIHQASSRRVECLKGAMGLGDLKI